MQLRGQETLDQRHCSARSSDQCSRYRSAAPGPVCMAVTRLASVSIFEAVQGSGKPPDQRGLSVGQRFFRAAIHPSCAFRTYLAHPFPTYTNPHSPSITTPGSLSAASSPAAHPTAATRSTRTPSNPTAAPARAAGSPPLQATRAASAWTS